MRKTIIKKVGVMPGKTVAVFAGVHGNERVGVQALDKLAKDLMIKAGTVYFVYANQKAIERNSRIVKKNLNRLFFRDNKGRSYEDARARELMKLLDACDALLDIHAYNSRTGNQFAICEPNANRIVQKMDFPIIVSGFSKLSFGTEGYMYQNGKVGLCVECGTVNRAKKFLPLAKKTIYQFLQHFGCIEEVVKNDSIMQKKMRAVKMLQKKSKGFRFVKKFKDFEPLSAGKVFAYDGAIAHKARAGERIIFPRPNVPVGGEVCIIAVSL